MSVSGVSSSVPSLMQAPAVRQASGSDSDGDNDASGGASAAASASQAPVSNPTATVGNHVNTFA